MSAKGTLKDASRLQWSVKTHVEDKEYYKRSASGRQKLKTKAKCKHLIRIIIEVPKSLYDPRTNLPEDVNIEDVGNYRQVKVKGKSKGKLKGYHDLNPALEDQWMAPRAFMETLVKGFGYFKKNPKFVQTA